MKLSVKWLTGLAAVALAVVAVVGSTSSTNAATGSIFVANEWSKITNESPAPSGYTSSGTVYATYEDGVRLIQTDSDLIRVIVKDPDADELTTATATDIAVGTIGGSDTYSATAGTAQTVFLVSQTDTVTPGEPIAGANSAIQVISGGVDLAASGAVTVVNRFSGNSSNDPWISVQNNFATVPLTIDEVRYGTSAIDQIDSLITVRSDIEPVGITIQADETGLSTGIFHGFVRIVSSGSTSALSTGAGAANAGSIRAGVGPVTFTFFDEVENSTRQTSVSLDTSAPTANVSGPTDGSATQNRQPVFSGSISDTGAGLDISSIVVAWDGSDDPDNTLRAVIDVGTGDLHSEADELSFSTSGAVDGDLAFSFSEDPNADIPAAASAPISHIVDWAVKAVDLAGNVGLSDADPATTGIQLHTVKIDQVIPKFSTDPGDNTTGIGFVNGAEVASRNSIRVVFSDEVTDVQASDFVVTLDSGATVVPVSVTVNNEDDKGSVYLTFLNNLVSNDTPRVELQDQIRDIAGNSTASGTLAGVDDGINPNLTVTFVGGSGTGSGSEGPTELTNNQMTIRITSDEPLTSAPAVTVYPVGSTTVQATPVALSQGTNTWDATFTKGSLTSGEKSVVVKGTDPAANEGTVGDAATASFRLDTALAPPVVKVGGSGDTTTQVRPFITIDFADMSLAPDQETSTVSISEILLDETDVSADLVASSNGKRFFITPSSDLSQGEHEVTIPAGEAADAAGNTNGAAITLVFTVNERIAFERTDIFAGWNGVSFPSNPIDQDIDSVFTNAGHDAVLGFDPMVPGQWRIATRDAVSGEFTTTTENGLNSIRSTQAYWVHSNNFESIEVLLVGETLPGAGSPPPIVSIPTVTGFNAVPIVDSSRRLTSGENVQLTRKDADGIDQPVTVSDYLGGVNEGRVVKWDPETLSFLEQGPTQAVETGTVLFVEVIGDPTPIFP